MSIMSDSWIREMAVTRGMIEPFVESQKREGVISFALSSYGCDARVSDACQFLFPKGDCPCEVSYADRAGKYMRQTGVTLPKL